MRGVGMVNMDAENDNALPADIIALAMLGLMSMLLEVPAPPPE